MKVKTFWKGLLIALAVIFTVGLIAGIFIKKAPEAKPKTYDYTISYIRADTGEDVLEDYAFMLKKTGVYPIGYNENSSTFRISDLNGKMEKMNVNWGGGFDNAYFGSEISDPTNRKISYGFYGWYLDEDCTIEFEGTIHEGTAEDLVLYAKIQQSEWSGGH